MAIKHCAIFALAIGLTGVSGSTASSPASVMATVQQFLVGFNQGNTKAMLTACAPQASIIDDFPPHHWQSCAAWADAWSAMSKQAGDTDATVTLAKPRHVAITGSVAYVVVPANYAYREKGKLITQDGSIWTLVLNKSAMGWRIVAWSWSDH
jgi:SnoaL-like domain